MAKERNSTVDISWNRHAYGHIRSYYDRLHYIFAECGRCRCRYSFSSLVM